MISHGRNFLTLEKKKIIKKNTAVEHSSTTRM